MARASIGKELRFEMTDEVGSLGYITIALREAKINIVHLLAYGVGETAYFQIVVSDPQKAARALSHDIKNVATRDVLLVEFENRLGTLSEVATLLGQNNINMSECYGTSSDGFKIVGVIMTGDNERARRLINETCGHPV